MMEGDSEMNRLLSLITLKIKILKKGDNHGI